MYNIGVSFTRMDRILIGNYCVMDENKVIYEQGEIKQITFDLYTILIFKRSVLEMLSHRFPKSNILVETVDNPKDGITKAELLKLESIFKN